MAILSTINTSSTKESFASKTMEENIASIAYDMRLQKEFTCVQVNGAHRYDSNGVCVYCGKDNPPLATLKSGSELQTALLTAMPSGGTVTFLSQNDVVDESTYSSKCNLGSDDSYAAVTGYTNSDKNAMVVKCADAFAIDLNEDSAGAFSSATKTFTFAGLNNLRSGNVVNGSKLFYKSNLSADELANWKFNNATDLSYAFANSNITKVPAAFSDSGSDMSKVTTFAHIFDQAAISEATEINCITSAALKDASYMFNTPSHAYTVSFGSNFDGSGITTLEYAFYSNSHLNSITILSLPAKLSSLESIEYAFYGVENIPSIDGRDITRLNNVSYAFGGNGSSTEKANLDPLRNLDISGLTSLDYMFYNCGFLTDISAISGWDTSNVTSAVNMFGGCTDLIDASALSSWDVSKLNIKDTQGLFMFGACIPVLPNWLTLGDAILDLSTVNAKLKQFAGNTSAKYDTKDTAIKSIKIHTSSRYRITGAMAIDTDDSAVSIGAKFTSSTGVIDIYTASPVIKISSMQNAFYNMTSLETITGMDNCTISSSEINMNNAFRYCSVLNFDNLKGFLSNIKSSITSLSWAFTSCGLLNDISFAKNWNMSNVTDLSGAFSGCSGLTDVSPISNWDVSKVSSFTSVFYNTGITDLSSLDNWVVTVEVYATNLFGSSYSEGSVIMPSWISTGTLPGKLGSAFNSQMKNIAGGNLNNIETINLHTGSDVTGSTLLTIDSSECSKTTASYDSSTKTIDIYTAGTKVKAYTQNMFKLMQNLKTITGFENLISIDNTFNGLFQGCNNLTNIDCIGSWDTSKIINMGYAFCGAGSTLSSLAPLANWNVSNVINFEYMFSGRAIRDISPLENWNISSATNISRMFNGNTALVDISALAKWDTSKVTTLDGVFCKCTALSDASGISNWNISNASNIGYLFYGCTSLTDATCLNNWDTSKVTTTDKTFPDGCTTPSWYTAA